MVEGEQVTFIEMEESYEATIGKAKKIIRGEFKPEDELNMQPDPALQLTSQRTILQNKIGGILDYVKGELEKVGVTTSRSSLKVQRDALTDAKGRLQEAKELTRELLTIGTQDHLALEQDQHRMCSTNGRWRC